MILYAHRGGRGEAPENTVAAFRYARRLYLEGVELDVRLSADNQLVVIHDDTVDRTTDGRGPVAKLKADKLDQLDARADFPYWPEWVGVPRLEDALDACSGIERIAIRIMPDDGKRLRKVCELLVELLDRRWIPTRVTISSSEPKALELIGHLAPHLACAYITDIETRRQQLKSPLDRFQPFHRPAV